MTNVFPLTSESLSFKNYALWELCHHPYIITTWRCSSAIWEHCHTVAGALGILQNLQKRRDFASQSNIKYIKEFPAMTTKELDKVMWMSDVLLDVVDACGCMMIHAGLSEESWFASARWWLTFSLLKPSATDPLVVNFTKGGHWFAGQSLVHPSSTQHCQHCSGVAETEACVFHSSDQ